MRPIGQLSDDLLDFFADRLKAHLREKGVRHDLVSAVFALGGEDDLVRLLARVDALQAFVASEDGEHLHIAYKRAANIVGIEEKKDGVRYDGADVDTALLREADEVAVAERLTEVSGLADSALAHEEFAAAMSALALLRKPVDSFFDNVTVNSDDADLRRNRLSLLASIRAILDRVADFSKIEG
jgi:glycyl-tRNA synthetase beta chain